MHTDLRMNVTDLLRHPGSTRAVHASVPVAGLATANAWVEEGSPLDLELRLEALVGGVVVSGRVRGRWAAACSRCLAPVERDFDLRLREVFEEDPVEEETYPLRNEEVDLEQPLRDLVVPDLPHVPLCHPDCAGLCPSCGANRNEDSCACDTRARDPRWDALRDLGL
ncbi:MAG: YceD family protein [Acidimicrobiia bacterium]